MWRSGKQERAGVETQGEGVVLHPRGASSIPTPGTLRNSQSLQDTNGGRRGVSGHQMGRVETDDCPPWRWWPGPLSPHPGSRAGAPVPLCRLFRHQSASSSFLCDILALHCSKSWPLDAVLSVSLMTFPPSLCTSSDSNRAPPGNPQGQLHASAQVSPGKVSISVCPRSLPSIKANPREAPRISELSGRLIGR